MLPCEGVYHGCYDGIQCDAPTSNAHQPEEYENIVSENEILKETIRELKQRLESYCLGSPTTRKVSLENTEQDERPKIELKVFDQVFRRSFMPTCFPELRPLDIPHRNYE